MKKWDSHALIGLRAVESLPAWERQLLPLSLVEATKSFPFFPKNVESPEEVLAAMCLITDQVYQPAFRRYCLLPNGHWIPHTVPDHAGRAAFQSGEAPSQAKCADLIQYLMQKMFLELKAANMLEMAFWAGSLGHFLQDAVAPSHTLSSQMLKDMFPDPIPGRYLRLGKWIYAVSDNFVPPAPIIAGNSIPDAACRLTWEVMKSFRRAREKLPRLLHLAYSDAPVESCAELLLPQVCDAAWLTASAWHTVFSLQKKTIPPAIKQQLASFNLIDAEPYFLHPGKYQKLIPRQQIINGSQTELTICQSNGNALPAPHNSFAMTGYSAVKFHIGVGVFDSFSCEAGITANWKEDANLIFSIETDTEENRHYSEELEYEANCLVAAKLLPGTPPKRFEVRLKDARTLLLCARSFPLRNGDDIPVFSIPDIAICNPVLRKLDLG